MSSPTTPAWIHDEYLAGGSPATYEAFARGLPEVVVRGETIVQNGEVHWKVPPQIECPRCGSVLRPGHVALKFAHAPTETAEQRVAGFVCECGEYYVPGETARAAHRHAFELWRREPELRIPRLQARALELMKDESDDESGWLPRFEAAVLLQECIRLESGRVRARKPPIGEIAAALERICTWSCVARDPVTANRAWEGLAEIGSRPPDGLQAMFEELSSAFAAALRESARLDAARVLDLARRFPGNAELWEHVAELHSSLTVQEDALLRSGRLTGSAGIRERVGDGPGDTVAPLTLGGAVVVVSRAA